MQTIHNLIFIVILFAGFTGLLKSRNFTEFAIVSCATLALFVLYLAFYIRFETRKHRESTQKAIDENLALLKSYPDNFPFKITDNISGDFVGELKRDDLFFLIKAFSEEGMKANDFYFLEELLELFEKEKKPPESLIVFLKKILEKKGEIELHWDAPVKTL
ncbi:hypothetical protein JXL83_06275 [candidate division WOR-3 bacterium]|nr:hypothetical protein [candidate division WOR-3 bacterium]